MKYLLVAAALAASATSWAQQPQAQPLADWGAWEPLIGKWAADPSPNGAVGGFSLLPDLQKRVLVRKNVADYPKTKTHHEDLMVVYRDGALAVADYWDNEGHVIHYIVALSDGGKTFTFLSEAVTGKPRFRLIYALTSASTLTLTFEIAPPTAPGDFKQYLKATAHKKP